MKVWRLDQGVLTLRDEATPNPGPGEVLVAMRAAAINNRDLGMKAGAYPAKRDVVALSDGAGVVANVGPGVAGWTKGDSVVTCFYPYWESGPASADNHRASLGCELDGVLAQMAIVPASALVAKPESLNFAEAATLPCAALTAWNCLFEAGTLVPGQTVLLQGTGGVSIFALQFAKAAGARVIITSSSDAKLERARALGADHGINYKTHPDWSQEALRLTGGRGVDVVIEVGGPGTLEQSLASVCIGGRIAYVGVLTGLAGQANPVMLIPKAAAIHGIFVGSRAMFADMLGAMTLHGIKPQIDREFAFGEAPAALARLQSGGHFGKIVIRVGG